MARSSRGKGRRIKRKSPEQRAGAAIWRALKRAGANVQRVNVQGRRVAIDVPPCHRRLAERVLAHTFGLRFIAGVNSDAGVAGTVCEFALPTRLSWEEKASIHRLIG